MKARLFEKYKSEVVPALQAKHNFQNVHQIPKFVKIVVNMGVSASLEKGAIEDAAKDLTLITGRKPATSKSRHSIANFKLREVQVIGCRVTLRRDEMYEFFDRLVAAALPRIRDFRGLSPRKFDGRGNYTFGVADQTIFPEIELEKIKRHTKKNQQNPQGAIVEREGSIHLSNVMTAANFDARAAKRTPATAPATT